MPRGTTEREWSLVSILTPDPCGVDCAASLTTQRTKGISLNPQRRFQTSSTTSTLRLTWTALCLQHVQLRTAILTLETDEVRRSFKRVNSREAPGPDGIPDWALRACAKQLAEVFTNIFNLHLSQAVVSTSFKASTIVPVPKKPETSCLNDYRPVALTSVT